MRRTWSSTADWLDWLVASDACTEGLAYASGNGISRSRPPLRALVVSNGCAARIQSDIIMFLKPHSALAISLSRRLLEHAYWPLRRVFGDKIEPASAPLSPAPESRRGEPPRRRAAAR